MAYPRGNIPAPMSLAKLHEHRRLWDAKPALRAVYAVWFERLLSLMPSGARVLEVGSGPGFFSAWARRHRDDLRWTATDLVATPWNALAADAQALPVRDGCLDVVVVVDVIHHLAAPARFFAECGRVLRPGGVLLALEPWVTPLSYPIYRFIHQEGCTTGIDPWAPFGAATGKEAFDGDGAVPWKIVTTTSPAEWERFGLGAPHVERLNGFAWLLTLGFRRGSLLPMPLCGAMTSVDRWTSPLSRLLGLRGLLRWERGPGQRALP